MLKVHCEACGEELNEPGSILLGPLPEDVIAITDETPNDCTFGKRKKIHICAKCTPSDARVEEVMCNRCRLIEIGVISIFITIPDKLSEISLKTICQECCGILFFNKEKEK